MTINKCISFYPYPKGPKDSMRIRNEFIRTLKNCFFAPFREGVKQKTIFETINKNN